MLPQIYAIDPNSVGVPISKWYSHFNEVFPSAHLFSNLTQLSCYFHFINRYMQVFIQIRSDSEICEMCTSNLHIQQMNYIRRMLKVGNPADVLTTCRYISLFHKRNNQFTHVFMVQHTWSQLYRFLHIYVLLYL